MCMLTLQAVAGRVIAFTALRLEWEGFLGVGLSCGAVFCYQMHLVSSLLYDGGDGARTCAAMPRLTCAEVSVATGGRVT